jgi:AAA family ATP:ADP antiporter
MLLFGVVGTAFYAAQTELLGEELDAAQDQRAWLADVEVYSQGFVLLLQVFCTGRLLKVLPAAALLVSLPVVSMLGLYVWWLAPTAASIFFVQVARRGARFALEKPAREVLYTPFDLATKHKVKFLLDTFAYRLGDLLGAFLQVGLRDLALGTGAIVAVTVGVAALSIFVAVGIARGQRASSPIS